MKIKITAKNIECHARLNSSETAKLINALPLKGAAKVWGEEIYFEIPMHIDKAPDAKEDVDIGDLGFWPEGNCFCIFFGKTPASTNEHPKAASPVNIFGRIVGDSRVFKQVNDGDDIKIEKIE